MNLMVEQERRNVESLRQELAAASGASASTSPSPSHDQRQQELDQAVRRLSKLEDQLDGLKAGKVCTQRGSSINVIFIHDICFNTVSIFPTIRNAVRDCNCTSA